MKKSIAILSMALLADNAFAADVLEAGTDEAPKYYVIKANRGIPYVTYTAHKKNNGGAETSLYRANEISEASVWGVVAGTEEGTVNIFNYTTKDDKRKQYMFTFITKDDTEFVGDANSGIATTGGVKDVYVKDNGNGSYGLALLNETGVLDGQFWGLDATGGTSEFLGNWQSVCDGGTQWWFYAVDDTNGIDAGIEAVQNAILESAMKAMVDTYSNAMASYVAAVPWVEAEFNEGIAALSRLKVSNDYEAQITAIWEEYVGRANTALKTVFNGKEVAFMNLRRKANNANPYISVGKTNYIMAENSADPYATFILESATYVNEVETSDAYTEEIPSYYMYNVATQKYYGEDNFAVDTKEEAASIRFMFRSNDGFFGVNIFVNGIVGDLCVLNADKSTKGYLTYGSETDNGSIWAIVDPKEEIIPELPSNLCVEISGNGNVYNNTLESIASGTEFDGSDFEFIILPF